MAQSARGFYDEGSSAVTEEKIPPTPLYKGGGLHGCSTVKEMQNTIGFFWKTFTCWAGKPNLQK